MERAIVLADGEPATRRGLDEAWPGWGDSASLVVAADGGARLAAALDLRIDLWVGDGDSLGQAEIEGLRRSGVPIEFAATDKDESDTELALLAAVARGANDVTIVGGLGGPRLDHALANVALLAHPALGGLAARIVDDRARVSLLSGPGRLALRAAAGTFVSLLPFGGDVDGVTTDGLRFGLSDEPLRAGPARGLSNIILRPMATVAVRTGRLLVVETPARLSP